MNLAEKLIQLRKKNGLTQLKLAEMMNVSRQAISRWEVGDAVPSTENLKYLSSLYGVSTEYLLNDEIQEPERSAGTLLDKTVGKDEPRIRRKKRVLTITAVALSVLLIAAISLGILVVQRKNKISMDHMEGRVVETFQGDFSVEW